MRQREKFERTDVPVPSRARDVVAVVVIIVVFAVAFWYFSNSWRRATSYDGFGDSALEAGVAQQTDVAVPQDAGVIRSGDDITNILVLSTSDATTLTGARILSVDETTQTMALADLPLDLQVTYGDQTHTLQDLFFDTGAAACVAPVSAATMVSYDDVFVTDETFWPTLDAYCASDRPDLEYGTAVRESVHSDLSNRKIDDLLDQVAAIGTQNATQVQTPVTTTDAASVVDGVQLNLALGTYVAA